MRSLFFILGCLLVLFSIEASGQMTDDFVSTDEDTQVSFNVTDNDDVFLPQPNTVDLNTMLLGRQTSATTDQGTYTVNNSGEVKFTPVDDFYGFSTLQYSMNYGLFGLTVGTATITVTINSVNDPPVARNDEEETDEDKPIDIKVLSNDKDPDDGIDPSTIVITETENGTFFANPSGEVTFTPTPDFHGNAKAKYTVRDFAGATSNKADIKVRVNSINDPPVTVNDVATTDEGESVEIKILSNDDDIDGSIDESTVLIRDETGGTFRANNKGVVTFTPDNGATGFATAIYTVKDNEGLGSKETTITVTINSVNKPPIATNDNAIMPEDGTPIEIKVYSNDTDPDGTLNLASVIVTDNVNGTFATNSSGSVFYAPPANFNGIATAKYTIKDNEGSVSNEATITVTVTAVNDNPSFDPIDNQHVLENSGSKAITITGISAGPQENETLTFKATSDNTAIVPNPVVTPNPIVTNNGKATLTFKPQPNQSGTVTITVVLTDQGGNTATRKFEIEVIKVEFISVPVTIAVTGQLYEYDIEVTPVDETLTIVATQKPAWTTLVANGHNGAKLRGTPPGNAPLTNPVTLQLKDGATVLDQQQFTITINRPPTVTSFGLATLEDTPLAFNAQSFEDAFTDPDNQTLSEIMFTQTPSHGSLKIGGTTINAGDKVSFASISSVSYYPEPNSSGLDTLYWKGSDGYSFSLAEAYVNFVINPFNDAPVIDFIETAHLEYELGSELPIKVTAGIKISDVDNTNLKSAEIRILPLLTYEPGKEVLLFKDTLSIAGSFNAAAGILILSGNSSVANYEVALRTIKYNYINLEQVKTRPTEVSFTISDGESTENTSAPKSRTIDLIYTFKDLDIPNAFSPNGDRANEAWVISSPNTTNGSVPYTEALVRVYNKRGLLVYEAKGFEKPWDGTFQGKELPVDTYFYTIDLKYNRVRYKGVVTILR